MFKRKADEEAIAPISGLPLPPRSEVKTLYKEKEIIPGSKIKRGWTEGKKEEPKRNLMIGFENMPMSTEIKKIIKRVCRATLGVRSVAFSLLIAEIRGKSTVAMAPGRSHSFSIIPLATEKYPTSEGAKKNPIKKRLDRWVRNWEMFPI